ncbi:MAG: GNAT family N-acetyltransferase, partial [Deltaproteobacteria bacterium]
MSGRGAARVRELPRVGAVPRATWDAVVGPEATPFESHGFLTALEDSGAVGAGTGWAPRVLVAEAGADVVGAA